MIRELILIHPEEEMADAFRERFYGLPNVRVCRCSFEELSAVDCFVTAGNAYGMMSAGIDAAVVRRFGPRIEQDVQQHIRDHYRGEQPIGTAFVVATGDEAMPYLAHAPTMRVPGSIDGTDKVYSATWAALLAVAQFSRAQFSPGVKANQSSDPHAVPIETVAMPAMGTGFGAVPFTEAARQMAVAYRHFLEPPHRFDWDFVAQRQLAICYDGKRQLIR